MQFSLEKILEKVKWIHPTHHTSRWIMLWGIRFINSIRNVFIFLKMFIMQQRRNSWDEIKVMGCENWLPFSYALAIIYVSSSAMCVWYKTDSKSKWVEKTHSMVVLSPNYVNLWCFVVTRFVWWGISAHFSNSDFLVSWVYVSYQFSNVTSICPKYYCTQLSCRLPKKLWRNLALVNLKLKK